MEEKMNQKALRLIFQEGDLPSLHPHRNISHIRCVSLNKLLFESLTRIDESQKAVLAGASSVDISEDKLNYTFTLRDCKYSNGKKVTAYDYEAAWRAAISPDSLCIRPDLFYVIKNARAIRESKKNSEEFGVKALDEKTLKIQLEHPYEALVELFSCLIFAPIKESNLELQIFNGPYIVDRWSKGKSLQLLKNQNYWDKENIHLNTIEINFIKNIKAGLLQFHERKIDWIGSPISVLPVKNLRKKNNFTIRSSNFIFWLYINTELSHFQSKDIRKAFSLAIDRKYLNETILFGDEPISFLPSNIALSKMKFEYNPEKAKTHFIKGLEKLKIDQGQFPEIKLSYFDRPEMNTLANYLKLVWEKVLQIKVQIIEQDWNCFRESQENNNFEIAGCYESSLFPGPLDLLQLIESKFVNDNIEYQKDILALKRAVNDEEKRYYLKKVMNILAAETPIIVLSNEKEAFSVVAELKGFFFDCANSIDFSRAYFEKI
jgi:oligopeptide transport system substrate-binding protein